MPQPELDEAMKAMQEVNELRAQLEASTARLKKFTLPDPAAEIPSTPAAIAADPAEAAKAVDPLVAAVPPEVATPLQAAAPLEATTQALISEPAASVSAAAQAESAVAAMSAPEVMADTAQGAGEAAAQMASAAQEAGGAVAEAAAATQGATGAMAEALHAMGDGVVQAAGYLASVILITGAAASIWSGARRDAADDEAPPSPFSGATYGEAGEAATTAHNKPWQPWQPPPMQQQPPSMQQPPPSMQQQHIAPMRRSGEDASCAASATANAAAWALDALVPTMVNLAMIIFFNSAVQPSFFFFLSC